MSKMGRRGISTEHGPPKLSLSLDRVATINAKCAVVVGFSCARLPHGQFHSKTDCGACRSIQLGCEMNAEVHAGAVHPNGGLLLLTMAGYSA